MRHVVSFKISVPHSGDTNLRPTIPATIGPMQASRATVAASPSMLLGEIARATVVQPDSLPPNEVDVRDNIRQTTDRLRIVCPREEDTSGNKISVLTSTALIGSSEGASIDWCSLARDGRSLTVLQVHRRTLKKGPVVRQSA
jgi:hypothetical protein